MDFMMDVKMPSEKACMLGEKIPHIKKQNYDLVYGGLIENERYTVCFTDMSLACLYYIFDRSGCVVGHNLVYIPAPNDENGNDDFDTICAKYIRIDYDQIGYHEIDHTKVHLHVGLYKTNFRIPIAHYCTPKEFIYIIAKYIYHSEAAFVNRLISPRNKNLLLSDNEQKALKMLFGRFDEII